GTYREVVLVEMAARLIIVVVETEHRLEAVLEGVLPIEVGNHHHLVAPFAAVDARIQLAIGILFEHIKVCRIEVIAVVLCLPEDTSAEIEIVKNEGAKIAVELLDTDAHKGRVITRAFAFNAAFAAQERNQLLGIA